MKTSAQINLHDKIQLVYLSKQSISNVALLRNNAPQIEFHEFE